LFSRRKWNATCFGERVTFIFIINLKEECMSFKKFAFIPVLIGVLAFGIQVLDQLLAPSMPPKGNVGFSWICFQSWAVYFFAGCSLRGGIKAFLGYAVGIVISIGIILWGTSMQSCLGFYAVPLAVGVIACAVLFLERVEWLSMIPAIFIGAGAFFAFMNYVPDATLETAALTEIVYCLIGLVFGYVTITLRTLYEKKVSGE
jgi:drug/metabolite transporter (DMT)-like permease